MNLGYIVLTLFAAAVYVILYLAIGNDLLIFTAVISAILVVFGALFTFRDWLIKVVDRLGRKPRPAPSLPLELYGPDNVSVIAALLVSGGFTALLIFVDSHHNWWATGFFILLGPICFLGGLWSAFHKRRIVRITTEGVHGKLIIPLCGKRDFVTWHEIQSAETDIVGGRVPRRILRITLTDDTPLWVNASMSGVNMKELDSWFMEYLSRYGSGAKQNLANEG